MRAQEVRLQPVLRPGRERGPTELGPGRIVGWYGNSAVEAAVHGIPTIAHLSEQALDQAARAGFDVRAHAPILNTAPGAAAIRRTVESYLALSPDRRTELSLRTRRWVEEFHSYTAVGPRLAELYDDVLERRLGTRSAVQQLVQ